MSTSSSPGAIRPPQAATACPLRVTVNGEPREFPAGSTVAELLRTLGLDERRLAVERNREIVPRSAHATTALAEGDRIEIVTMVGGG